MDSLQLSLFDLLAFAGYIVGLLVIGYWAGRNRQTGATEYFLAGRSLPWYAVGGSYVATNISSEHFIGMLGAAYIYGVCISLNEWRGVWTLSLLVWFFIPFLLGSGSFTVPEFLEKRFNAFLRQFFAFVTVICNVTVFLAAVLYGGGLALAGLFEWDLRVAILVLAIVAGVWAVQGGLSPVVWTDLFTIAIMVIGGLSVTYFGLLELAGDDGSVIEGFRVMMERNAATADPWRRAVEHVMPHILPGAESYDRLSVIQPLGHPTHPWPFMVVGFLAVSLWFHVLNQTMIQRVFGARDMYHARMGIIFAGYLKAFMPVLVIFPGLIYFARSPEILMLPWAEVKAEADKGYVRLVQELVPIGLRGLLLAAFFGAVQSTINSVLNSTATVFTLDLYKGLINRNADDAKLVRVGVWASALILAIAIGLAILLIYWRGSVFVYMQTLVAFFAPPFSAVFLIGLVWRRINGAGAIAAVFAGFATGIGFKALQGAGALPALLSPYENQAIVMWVVSLLVCALVSLATPPPPPEKLAGLTLQWNRRALLGDMDKARYKRVLFWWLLYIILIIGLVIFFSGWVR